MIYEVQETQSQCPQCSRHKRHQEYSSEDSQQQQPAYRKVIIPIKKTNGPHQNFEKSLSLLQREVERLKIENEQKEKKIRKLESQINIKQVRFYPENAKIGSIYQNEIEVGQKSSIKKKHNADYFSHDQLQRTHKRPQNQATLRAYETSEIDLKIKQITWSKNEKIKLLEQDLLNKQKLFQELQQRLDQQINDNEWLTKFCLSFVNMAGQVSKYQGKLLIDPSASLRKNTKVAWKFLKQFLSQVVS